MTTLTSRTVFISGASRGIGLAIAERLAAAGANIALIAKTDQPHPRLAGTVHTAAAAIERAGGQALPIVGDIRSQEQVAAAVAAALERFGHIDVCINNASALNLAPMADPSIRQFDLPLMPDFFITEVPRRGSSASRATPGKAGDR